jgi:hypothetical protein
MRYLSIIILFTLTGGCHARTEYGECIGLSTNNADPNLVYKLDVWNTFWSFIGIETVIAPILWATDYAQCPIKVRN